MEISSGVATMRNRIISIIFVIIIMTTSVGLKSYNYFSDLVRAEIESQFKLPVKDEEKNVIMNQTVATAKKTIDDGALNALPYKTNMVKFNGSFLKFVGTRSYYNSVRGMNITSNGYNVGVYGKTSTDYEYEQIVMFKEYLDSKGIKLLYVNEPAKYIDDAFYTEQFGGKSYLNKNMDKFLKRIKKAGIDYLDLREASVEDGLDSLSMFYKTDHHWTVPASEWAAYRIAKKLNDDYGYNIDLSLYNTSRFNFVEYKDAWLGEQGKLVADTYIGLDDYTMMEPTYETSYTVVAPDESVVSEGDFGIFINKGVYDNLGGDVYASSSWHYSYSSFNNNVVHNNLQEYGNILVLGDSYEASMAPFLSLGIRDMKVVIPRDLQTSVHSIVESGQYDTVIMTYAQFMLGSHTNESNANYKMFTLE